MESSIFSDKSFFISEILQYSDILILIDMPRQWGKSCNLDMLRRFLSVEFNEKFELIQRTEGENYKLFFSKKNDPEECLDISNVQIIANTKTGSQIDYLFFYFFF